jgi:hypothetical protein
MDRQMTAPKRLRAVKDRRSTWARRHKKLADTFARDLGGSLSTVDLALAAHAATVAIECERMRADQLNGEPVDLEDLVRVVRTELGKRAKPADEGFDWVQLQEEAARMIREEDAQRRQGANDSPQRSETA